MYARFEGINFVLLMEARGVTRSLDVDLFRKIDPEDRRRGLDWNGSRHDMDGVNLLEHVLTS
jgi:hypothetical protein